MILIYNFISYFGLIFRLFQKIDRNGDSYVSAHELRALILGIQIKHTGLDEDDFTIRIIEEFDVSDDSQLSEEEFVNGLSNWLISAKDSLHFVSLGKHKLSSINSKVYIIFNTLVEYLLSLTTRFNGH